MQVPWQPANTKKCSASTGTYSLAWCGWWYVCRVLGHFKLLDANEGGSKQLYDWHAMLLVTAVTVVLLLCVVQEYLRSLLACSLQTQHMRFIKPPSEGLYVAMVAAYPR
jgi:hypothetical protein